jgi:hypothetical protein
VHSQHLRHSLQQSLDVYFTMSLVIRFCQKKHLITIQIHSARFLDDYPLRKLKGHLSIPCQLSTFKPQLIPRHIMNMTRPHEFDGRENRDVSGGFTTSQPLGGKQRNDCEHCEKCRLERILAEMEHSPTCNRSTNIEAKLRSGDKPLATKPHIHIREVCACGTVLYVSRRNPFPDPSTPMIS